MRTSAFQWATKPHRNKRIVVLICIVGSELQLYQPTSGFVNMLMKKQLSVDEQKTIANMLERVHKIFETAKSVGSCKGTTCNVPREPKRQESFPRSERRSIITTVIKSAMMRFALDRTWLRVKSNGHTIQTSACFVFVNFWVLTHAYNMSKWKTSQIFYRILKLRVWSGLVSALHRPCRIGPRSQGQMKNVFASTDRTAVHTAGMKKDARR